MDINKSLDISAYIFFDFSMYSPKLLSLSITINAPILERLRFSEGYVLSLCVGLGYADEAPEAKPRDKSKVLFVR